MVECDLAKVEVAGSTPVSRSRNRFLALAATRVLRLIPRFQAVKYEQSQVQARYPSGKGEVCKTFMRRFDSDPRLQLPQQRANPLLLAKSAL